MLVVPVPVRQLPCGACELLIPQEDMDSFWLGYHTNLWVNPRRQLSTVICLLTSTEWKSKSKHKKTLGVDIFISKEVE